MQVLFLGLGLLKMRLDKFLKVSRLVKRRTVANALCDAGGVEINGKVAKASSSVSVGNRLVIHWAGCAIEVEILEVPLKAPPAQAAHLLYREIGRTYHEAGHRKLPSPQDDELPEP